MFEAAANGIKKAGLDKLPSTEKLNAELDTLAAQKAALEAAYQKAQKEEKQYDTLRRNVDMLLDAPKGQEHQRQRSNDLE